MEQSSDICLNNLYKKRYCLAFYDHTDEVVLYIFDNVNEILLFQKKEVNSCNKRIIYIEIYRALTQNKHRCRFLTGELMYLYLVDFKEDDEEIGI